MPHIRNAVRLGLAAMLALPAMRVQAIADGPKTQTIVLVRHGEKPALGLGQLTCQGLNRALALPAVIEKIFGKPNAVFAPDPGAEKADAGKSYDYVRPLATIEPTAVAAGLPVNASIGLTRIDLLEQALNAPEYRDALVLVGWEHYFIVQLVRHLMSEHGGDPLAVPDWKGSDYDSVYVVRIKRTEDTATITFTHQQEGLDGQPLACPGHPS